MKILLIILLSFISINIFSQKKIITISLVDSKSNSALAYSNVCLENKKLGIKKYKTTDLKGKASFEYLGVTIISISSVGYNTIIDTINTYMNFVEYELVSKTYNIAEYVITGQNKLVSIDKSIYSINVIGSEKIELQASNNLGELLNNELGIQINNDPSTGSSVKLQGISGENVKILIDGVPMIGRMDGNIDLSQINLDNVDHIEIVEGPMSVLYGSNALAGVINIITKENKYAKLKANIDTYYESVGTYNINGNLFLKKKNNSIGLSFGRNFFDGFSTVDSSRAQEWKPKEQYLAGFYYTFRKKAFKMKYKVDGFRERLLSRNNPSPPYFNRGNDIWFYTIRLNNSLQGNYDINDLSSINFMFSYSYYSRRKQYYTKDLTNLETILSPNANDTTVFHAFVSRAVYNYHNKSNKLNYQLGYDINLETGSGKRIKNNYQQIGDYAAFASLQWNITKKIIFQPAFRASYNTKYNAPITPSLNLKYQFKKSNLRLSYSRGFRAPSLKELYLYFYDSNHQIEGNENLKAENSHNYNIALNNEKIILKKNVKFKLTGFYNKINDMITLVQVDADNGLLYKNENIGKFESIGSTFNIKVKLLSMMDLNMGVSITGTKDNYFETDNFIYSNNANTSIIMKFMENSLAFSVFYKYIGKMPQYYYGSSGNLELGHINSYNNMDVTMSKSFFSNKLKFSTGIKNIFNNVSINSLGGSGTAHSSGGTGSLVGWGRTYFVGLKYNFSIY